MKLEKDLYFVAVKVFLEQKGTLFIFKDRFGAWDLPGGRLRETDFQTPLGKVVARKIKEELGLAVRYKLGEPVVFMRHERMEHLTSGKKEKRRIFAVGYQAKYLSGKINLGKNHVASEWVALKNFHPEKHFTGGWLLGVQQYLKLK